MRLQQTSEFAEWLSGLRDRVAQARISSMLARVAHTGHLGDVKSVGDGVSEMRFFFGPGYRVYFMRRGEEVILLLAGGDKSTQQRDIEKAKELAALARAEAQDD